MFTKTSVTILIGSPPDAVSDNYFVKVLNSGKTLDGKDFHNWDKEGFKANVLHHFVRFLAQTSSGVSLFFLSLCAIYLILLDGAGPTTPAPPVPASMASTHSGSAFMASTPACPILASAASTNQVPLAYTVTVPTSAPAHPIPVSVSSSCAPGILRSPALWPLPLSTLNTDEVLPSFSSTPSLH